MRSGIRRIFVVVALAAGVIASTAAAGAQSPVSAFPKATFGAQGVEVERLTDGVRMTDDILSPVRAFTSPASMLVHPDDPRVVVAATADLRSRICYLLVSQDAGATWDLAEELPGPTDYPFCTNTTAGVPEASIAWGSNGVLYYGMQAYGEGEGPRGGGASIALARTTDLGETWEKTIVIDHRAEPDPQSENTGVMGMAVDTSGSQDVVYVGYSREWRDTAPSDHPLNSRREVAVSVSKDGGRSFGESINLNDFSELTFEVGGETYPYHFQTAFGRPYLVAHDGVVMAVADGGPEAGEGPPSELYDGIFGEATPMLLARSTDQGDNWEVSELMGPVYNAGGSYTGMGWTPHGGSDGTFVFAYSATPGDAPNAGRSDIVVQRSTDLGVTWTDPVAINDDDPSSQYTSFYPQLDVAPNGRVDVVWQDNRNLTDYNTNVIYSYSTDGGQTWAPNMVVSDQPVSFQFGIAYNSDLRQPPGVASTNEYAAIAWADARLADEKSQTQDNFGVVAQFAALPSDEDASWAPVLAVVGGLGLAGIILLGVQAMRKKA